MTLQNQIDLLFCGLVCVAGFCTYLYFEAQNNVRK